jgi:hypothetical protein
LKLFLIAYRRERMKNIMKKGLMAMTASLLLLAASGTAQAVAPANSVITNTASLSYTGLATPLTASVDLTVTLVASAPTISDGPASAVLPADITVVEGTTGTVPMTLTATSNGVDTFNIAGTNASTNTTGTSAPTYTDALGNPITTVTLGATALAAPAAIGDTVLTVPSDGTANSQVNGLAAGDTIVIGNVPYTIASVVDNATGTSTITLTTPLTAPAAVGDLIAETVNVNIVLTNAGNFTVAGTPGFTDVTTTLTSQAAPAVTTSDVVRVNLTSVTFTKLVRNVTNPNGVGGTTVGAATYFNTAAGITAASGDVLEYYIVVNVPATGVAVSGAKIVDDIPAFTTYVPGSTTLNGAAALDVAGTTPLATINGGLTVNDAGSPAGSIAPGTSAAVTFQVTVQ